MAQILLIDVSHLFWSAWHATADQEVNAAFEATVAKVHKLAQGYDHIAVCCDQPPYKRKELYPAYKANREAAPPLAQEQFRRVKSRLEADGFLLLSAEGYEADDVIATVCAQLKSAHTITIASNDKDLLQLVDDATETIVLSTLTGAELRRADVIAKFGVAPEQLGDLLALMGDASDNVPGCKGIGAKIGAKLLLEFGSLMGIFQGIATIDQLALREKIFAGAELIRLSRALVTLDSMVPIRIAAIFEERAAKPIVDASKSQNWEEGEFEAEEEREQVSSTEQKKPSVPPPTPQMQEPQLLAPERAIQVSTPQPAIVPVGSAEWTMGLEPASGKGALAMAAHLHNSRLFPKFTSPQAIFAVIVRGRELGLGAIAALTLFHFHDGHLTLHAHLIIARAQALAECEYFEFMGGDGTYAAYETKHKKNRNPTPLRYTIEQAKVAGLVKPTRDGKPSNWMRIPEEMLRKTCGAQLVRIVYPAAAMGLYCPEELGFDTAA